MVKANCLIDVPTEVERINAGDTVTVQLLTGPIWAAHGDRGSSGSHHLSCC
jgi:molybdopterin molybdotransferase